LADQVKDQYENLLENYFGRVRSLKVAMDAIEKYDKELSAAMLTGYDDVPGVLGMPHIKVYGLTDLYRLEERDPTFAFKIRNVPDEEVVIRLWNKYGIALRAENYYSRALETYGVPTMIRVSFVHYNTPEEICTLLKALNEMANPPSTRNNAAYQPE
jgi:selenocysteine lyase/cysteine desulfurase